MQTLAKIGAGTEAVYAHLPHIPACSFAIDNDVMFSPQDFGHFAVAILRMLRVYLVDQAFYAQFFLADGYRFII